MFTHLKSLFTFGTCECDLSWKEGFCGCNQVEMRSCWIKMGPLSEDWHPYKERRDFPGGPVARTVPSNAGGAGLIPRWGAQISHASCRIPPPKKQQKSYCNKLSKDLKRAHIKNKTLKTRKEREFGHRGLATQSRHTATAA